MTFKAHYKSKVVKGPERTRTLIKLKNLHGTTQLLNFDAPGCHEDRLDDVGVKE